MIYELRITSSQEKEKLYLPVNYVEELLDKFKITYGYVI